MKESSSFGSLWQARTSSQALERLARSAQTSPQESHAWGRLIGGVFFLFAYVARYILRASLGDSVSQGGGIPFWRCAFGVIIQLGVLPSVMVALCSARGGGPLLFPWPSRLQAWGDAWVRSRSGVWEWAFGYVFALFFTFDLILVPLRSNVIIHHVVCLIFHGWIYLSPCKPGLHLFMAGCIALEVGTGFSNLLMLMPRRDSLRLLFVIMMTLSNVTGAYLTYRWIRVQQGRLVALVVGPITFMILVLRQLHGIAEGSKLLGRPLI